MIDFEKYFKDATNKEELIKDLKAEIGRDFVARVDFNEKNEELKKANELISTYTSQLDDLSKSSGDKNALKSEIEALKKANAEAAAKYEADMKAFKLDTAIKSKLSGVFQPDTIDYIKTLVKTDNLTFAEDGTLLGLEEQLAPLKETKKSFLLEAAAETANPKIVAGGMNKTASNLTKQDILAIKNPVERQHKIAENIELFK